MEKHFGVTGVTRDVVSVTHENMCQLAVRKNADKISVSIPTTHSPTSRCLIISSACVSYARCSAVLPRKFGVCMSWVVAQGNVRLRDGDRSCDSITLHSRRCKRPSLKITWRCPVVYERPGGTYRGVMLFVSDRTTRHSLTAIIKGVLPPGFMLLISNPLFRTFDTCKGWIFVTILTLYQWLFQFFFLKCFHFQSRIRRADDVVCNMMGFNALRGCASVRDVITFSSRMYSGPAMHLHEINYYNI